MAELHLDTTHEFMDYQPKSLKSGVVFWVRKRGSASGSMGEELEACIYPAPEAQGYWYRFYENIHDEIPRIEIWHYGDLSPVKLLSSASNEFLEFRNLDRQELCALAGVFAAEQIEPRALTDMMAEDRALLVRRARIWAKNIDWM